MSAERSEDAVVADTCAEERTPDQAQNLRLADADSSFSKPDAETHATVQIMIGELFGSQEGVYKLFDVAAPGQISPAPGTGSLDERAR